MAGAADPVLPAGGDPALSLARRHAGPGDRRLLLCGRVPADDAHRTVAARTGDPRVTATIGGALLGVVAAEAEMLFATWMVSFRDSELGHRVTASVRYLS